MNIKIQNGLWAIIICLMAFSGCKKFDQLDNIETPEQNAEFAVPLFSTETSIKDILENFDENTFITVRDDGLILLNYKGDFISRNSLDLFEGLGQLDNVPLPILDTVTVLPIEFPNSVELDYAILSNGLVRWGWQNPHPDPITVTVRFPSVFDQNGEAFTHVVSDFTGDLYLTPSAINLAGYRFETINDSLIVEYEVLKQDGTKDKLNNFFLLVSDFEASYVEGYLGQDVYELDRDTIEIEFFENWTRGDVYFEDPKVFTTVENSFGFPVRSQANVFEVITVNGEKLALQSQAIDNGIDIDYPEFNEVGEVKTTYFTFDKTNSNIDSILGSNPVALDYDLDALPNPDGNTAIRGFLTDSSFFKVKLEVELPVYGKSLGFAANDTIDFNLSDYDDIENVEFKVITDNNMPLELALKIYFAQDDKILDSLFTDGYALVDAAEVDMDGNVIEPVTKTTFVDFNDARLDAIRGANKIYVTVDFTTYNGGQTSVRILADQEVKVRMGMKVGLDL